MFDTELLYQKLRRADPSYYTVELCREIAKKLEYINQLKRQKKAVILAHNYQRPEIFEIADFIGDSLGLSLKAADVGDAEVIVFCGVHFMAEIAKTVSPHKKVLLPNIQAGCALADTADADDLALRLNELREKYPDIAVVSYVNTTAAVKALSDACCTSSNAVDVVKALPNKTILFVPDQNLAHYVAGQVPEKTIIAWDGFCYVHHELQPEHILQVKQAHPNLKVVVHPECRDDLVQLADAVLSTSGMVSYAQQSEAMEFLAVTECGLSDLLTIQVPDKQFFRACKICRYMKMITLDEVLKSLENLAPEIILDEDVRIGSERAIRRMFELATPDRIPASLLRNEAYA